MSPKGQFERPGTYLFGRKTEKTVGNADLERMDTNIVRNADTGKMADVSGTSQLVALWLHGKSSETARSYESDIRRFVAFLSGHSYDNTRLNDIDLRTVKMNDVVDYCNYLDSVISPETGKSLSADTRKRRIFSIKSLLRFGHEVNFLKYNAALKIKPPQAEETLAERIITELEYATLIALSAPGRERTLIKFLYQSGARVGEVATLAWRNIKPNRNDKWQVSFFGKGSDTRVVVISRDLYDELKSLTDDCTPDAAVFVSRKGGNPLQDRQIRKIIKKAGERAGIKGLSPHWLRHVHASHSLDRGAPIHLVQKTLGYKSLNTTSKYTHARPDTSSGMYLMQ